jgi:hypothetical protein
MVPIARCSRSSPRPRAATSCSGRDREKTGRGEIRMRRVPDPEPAEKVWLSRLGLTLPKCKRRHDETDQDDAVPTLAWNEDILETKRGRKLFASPFHFPAWNEDILETKRGRKLFASPFHFRSLGTKIYWKRNGDVNYSRPRFISLCCWVPSTNPASRISWIKRFLTFDIAIPGPAPTKPLLQQGL